MPAKIEYPKRRPMWKDKLEQLRQRPMRWTQLADPIPLERNKPSQKAAAKRRQIEQIAEHVEGWFKFGVVQRAVVGIYLGETEPDDDAVPMLPRELSKVDQLIMRDDDD